MYDNLEGEPRDLTLNDYQAKAAGTAVFPVNFGAVYTALALLGEAAEYAEKVLEASNNVKDDAYFALTAGVKAGQKCEGTKKLIRSGAIRPQLTATPSAEQAAGLRSELGDIQWYVAAAAGVLDSTLGSIAQANLDKLASRKQRAVIEGNGDNR